MHRKAVRHLRTVDPVLGGVIDRVGPCRLATSDQATHFEALARSIVFQQLSGKAAATIHGRFAGLFDGKGPHAAGLLSLPEEALRGAGLSRQKASYLRDFAQRVSGGELPIESMAEFADDDVVRHLTRVKGVGRWTAQMFLLFRLGRPDVLPELDLGVQKAIQKAYKLRKRPTPDRVLRIGTNWTPHRSVATWYLWRSLEVGSRRQSS
jgi:DNA-3-methyladenine glycosylase II